jgi:hypothetical protein
MPPLSFRGATKKPTQAEPPNQHPKTPPNLSFRGAAEKPTQAKPPTNLAEKHSQPKPHIIMWFKPISPSLTFVAISNQLFISLFKIKLQ